jgi:hypothetical protein
MRKIIYTAIIITGTIWLSSCEEDLGLFSDDPRDAFTGEWSVKEENSLKSTDYYNVSIEKSETDSTLVLINNFYAINYSASARAKVDGGTITLPVQNMSGFTIKGSGSISLNDKNINWSYTVDHNNGFVDQVTATYTRIN